MKEICRGFGLGTLLLRSSFTRHIRFPDYTVYEMMQMTQRYVNKKGYSLSQQAERLLEAQCAKEKKSVYRVKMDSLYIILLRLLFVSMRLD